MKQSNSIPIQVEQYLKKADEKLESARFLFSGEFYDDAISRIYYAIFHAVAAALRFLEVDLSNHKHQYILQQFNNYFVMTEWFPERLFSKINLIKNTRESADYSSEITINKEDIENYLNDSQEIVDSIKELIRTYPKEA